jgi:hypothetical protein
MAEKMSVRSARSDLGTSSSADKTDFKGYKSSVRRGFRSIAPWHSIYGEVACTGATGLAQSQLLS